MGRLLSFARQIDRITEKLGRFISWLILIMVLIGAFNALARKQAEFTGVNLSSNAFIETQWYLFAVVFLLGASYTFRHGGHVRVDVFYGRLGKRGKARINLLGNLIFMIPFCLFMLYFTWPSLVHSWQVMEQSPDPGGLPRYPIKSVIPLAFSLLLLQGLADTIKQLAVLQGLIETDQDEIQARENQRC